MLLIDDALDAPSDDITSTNVITTGTRKEIAVSVDVDAVHGIRVQTDGLLSALNAEFNSAGAKRTGFDVVLPEDNQRGSGYESGLQASDADKPHRPYEQLFSELRRRKGA